MADHMTIYDVASLAGVSISTVSRVLNTPGSVSPASKKKVIEAMALLNFVPKADAVARARKGFKRIGVVVPFFTSPSFVQRIRGIMSALTSTEYELIIYSIATKEQLQDYYAALPHTRKVDGLIILALPVQDEDVARFKASNLPVVLVEINHPGLSGILIDNRHGGKIAAEYLLKKGYSSLGFIGEGGQPAYSLNATDQRLDGYRAAIEENGHTLEPGFIVFHKYGMVPAIKAVKKLLNGKTRPDAIFTSSDIEAAAVLKVARELHISIPGELAVIGFDDIDMADYMGITTINQSLDDSGRTAVELLLEKMRNPDRPARNIMLDLTIVERFTT